MIDIRFVDAIVDIDQFKKLRLESLKNHPTDFTQTFEYESTRPDLYHINMLQNNNVAGAFDDNILVAFSILSVEHYKKLAHKCHTWGAYTLPEYRNIGLGRKIRTFLFDYAKNLGKKYVLSSIMASNKSAFVLNTSIGYEVMYIETNGIKQSDGTFEDLIHFRKEL